MIKNTTHKAVKSINIVADSNIYTVRVVLFKHFISISRNFYLQKLTHF